MASISIRVFGKDELVAKFRNLREKLPEAMREAMEEQMVQLADYVRVQKLSGDPLHRRSGTLSRAVTGKASVSGTKITGTTGTSGVPYAPVHEFGAVFTRQIEQVFGRKLKIPKSVTFHYPERAFLRPSLAENTVKITAAIRQAALDIMHDAT